MHDVPIVVGDARVGAHGARTAPGVVVLQAGAHVIRRLHVEGHVVGLRQHQVREVLTQLAARSCDMLTPPSPPSRMWRGLAGLIHIAWKSTWMRSAPSSRKVLAGVVGDVQLHAEHVDARVGAGIDADLAEVHRPRIHVAHLPPRGAGVVGAVDAALGGVLDARVEHVRVGAVDVHADAALGAGRNAGLDPRPRLAGVHRLPHAAARPAAVHAPLRATSLVGGGVQHLAVARVDDQLGGAGVVVDVQGALPGQAAVGGLVDAALAARGPQVAERRHVHHVEVDRVDDHPRDLLRRAQPHVLPRCGRRRST